MSWQEEFAAQDAYLESEEERKCTEIEDDGWTDEELEEAEESHDRFIRACLSGDVFYHSFDDIRVGGQWYPYDDAPF